MWFLIFHLISLISSRGWITDIHQTKAPVDSVAGDKSFVNLLSDSYLTLSITNNIMTNSITTTH